MDETHLIDELDVEPTWSAFIDSLDVYGDPVLCAVAAGAVLGFLSSYIVLRRMVFLSAAVTQAAGLGVAVAFYSGIYWGIEVDPIWGGVAFSLMASALLVLEPERLGVTREALLGIVFAASSGLAVLIGAKISQEAHDIKEILFGIGVLVEEGDLRRVFVAGLGVMALQIWWFRGLTFATFDPVAARIQGLPVRALDTALLLSIGVTIGICAKALGALPVFALSTMPAMGALAITRGRLVHTFVVAAVIGAISGASGYAFAFFRDYDVGASQTVVAVMIAVGCIGAGKGGSILRALRNRDSD